MAKVVIIGAGFAGHTAAIYLGNKIGHDHEITMVNKFDYFLYLPSLIWVGIGRMKPEKVRVLLKKIYDRINVRLVHGTASEVHPDEKYILAKKANGNGATKIDYDYLVLATGPNLNWEGTKGLGPTDGYTLSVCWLGSAIHSSKVYHEYLERMRRGERFGTRKQNILPRKNDRNVHSLYSFDRQFSLEWLCSIGNRLPRGSQLSSFPKQIRAR